MPVDAKAIFQGLCKKAYDQVASDHSSNTKTRISGYFNNRVRRLADSSGQKGAAVFAKGAMTVLFKPVPYVGGLLSFIGQKVADYARDKSTRSSLGGRITDARPEAGELLVNQVAQSYVDALRKLDDTSKEFARVTTGTRFSNCAEISDFLTTVYYYRYRMVRLRFYHEQMTAYANAVNKTLELAEQHWKAFEADLQNQGSKAFQDWTWHHANCGEVCYWPEIADHPGQRFGHEISGPFDVRTPDLSRYGSMKRLGPPPLPPRPTGWPPKKT